MDGRFEERWMEERLEGGGARKRSRQWSSRKSLQVQLAVRRVYSCKLTQHQEERHTCWDGRDSGGDGRD